MQSQSTFNPLTPHFTVLDIWSGLGTELEFKESRENFARSILSASLRLFFRCFLTDLILNIPRMAA